MMRLFRSSEYRLFQIHRAYQAVDVILREIKCRAHFDALNSVQWTRDNMRDTCQTWSEHPGPFRRWRIQPFIKECNVEGRMLERHTRLSVAALCRDAPDSY
ncbi:hypothetical protein PCH_Pc18g01700 [Penicillium rubens Wisconsin 54-1255]|uniref:Uncharacterized protein n=1 Tax=Penicillium rubens (strain ATCC 28089 / DSM 1075 / NRRL 1951 / Wisconsin 54-1255) TaxID=500485 RepID=B6HCH0_PENRW|nr:hypothetical protein PCH_Pc18g01700 [Penicillium rubens Wisconsin 54-1255]